MPPNRATLVYRLDPGQIEDLLSLDVTPEPEAIYRTAIVIHINADPDFQSKIQGLIRQLGDESWQKREAAQASLKTILRPARHLLEQALKNKDMEIVYRAEQLLEEVKSSDYNIANGICLVSRSPDASDRERAGGGAVERRPYGWYSGRQV